MATLGACFVLALAGSGLQDPEPPPEGPPPKRLPSTLEAIGGRIADGERRELTDAWLLVPKGYAIPAQGTVPLAIHFQGGVAIAEENFVRMGRPGVLIASTLAGRSSAFSVPFRDPAAFRNLLAEAAGRVREIRGGEDAVVFDPIVVTFFSAGYGAVRELLKEPEFFAKIDALISADSIYASVVAPEVRAPDAAQMVDFLRFAQAAARGEKVFVLAHGMIPTEYASTAECAALVFASVGAQLEATRRFTERGIPIAGEVHVGGLHGYRFAGADAQIHIDCLYMIPEWVRRHVAMGEGKGR